MLKRFFIFLPALLSAMILMEADVMADSNGVKPEGRAMWVVRFDVTSAEQAKNAVAFAKKNNFNTLVVQVRGRGDAYYKSNVEPRAEAITDPNVDPLQCYIDECRKAGIEIHAWLNTHYSWSGAELPKSSEHIVNKHPEWLMRDRDNEVTLTAQGQSEGAYTCPSNPGVKQHVVNCFLDVVENYDVDGVHFDFVRYPSIDYCFCDGCLARFKERMDKVIAPDRIAVLEAMKERLAYVQMFPEAYDQFRRDQITELVGMVYRRAHRIKPGIVVSASVFPSYDDAYNHRFQDWKLWMKLGIVDVLYPMIYAPETETFATHCKDAVESSCGRQVFAGIGQWRITPESSIEKIRRARELGADGISLFSYGASTKDGTNDDYLAAIREAVFQTPASVPEIGWLPK